MTSQAAENKNEITPKQLEEARRIGRILRHFLVADIALVLFLTFGYAFPSKIETQQSEDADVAYQTSYEYVAKRSPLDIPKEYARAPRMQVSRVSARKQPPPVVMPAQNTISLKSLKAANAEADLTMKRRST